MSHVQILRHAIDAARAGNPDLARVHLQKAAEGVPDDPAVWLWLSWLADSPVSMIQCLELVRRHKQYRDIAESGLAFARGLARFDCEALLPADAASVAEKAGEESIENETWAVFGLNDDDTPSDDGRALDAGDDEFTANSWDGIDLLSRTADAVEDELRSDHTSLNVEETLSFPEVDFEVYSESTASSEDSDDEFDKQAADEARPVSQPAADDGSWFDSWFDYWLPQSERSGKPTREAPAVPSSGQSLTGLETEEHDPATGIEAETLLDDNTATSESSELSTQPPLPTRPPVETGRPASDLNASDKNSRDETPHDPAAFQTDHARPNEAAFNGYAPPVARNMFDVPSMARSEDTPPPLPSEAALNRDTEVPGPAAPSELRTTPKPVRQPIDFWRAAKSDWFRADEKPRNSDGLVPHKSRVVSDSHQTDSIPPAFSTPPAVAPGATHAQTESATRSEPGQPDFRVANRSLFDAEPTPPALIPPGNVAPGTAPNTNSGLPESGLAHTGTSRGNSLNTEVAIGQTVPDASQANLHATSEEAPGRQFPPSQQRIHSSDGRTILVVDDSPTVRKLVEMSLERNGFRVVHAFDGVAAIKEIARHDPSLILMDVNMPRLDGYQLCKLVKKHETTRHIAVVMLTSKEGVFDKLRGRMVGCSGYIAKPFSPDELNVAVERFLSEPATL